MALSKEQRRKEVMENYKGSSGNWRNKKENKEDGPELKITSFYDDEKHLYEQVVGPGFACYDKKTKKISYIHSPMVDGFKLTPLGERAVETGLVMLPEEAVDYGTDAELLEDIRQHIHNYVDITEDMEHFAAYYVLLSWVYDKVNTVCYLRALGDTGSGKTRFLDAIGRLCYKATMVSGAATAAPIFRLLEVWKGTMVIDESDFAKSDTHQDIIKILNSGFERGKPVVRCSKDDPNDIEVHRVFGPKILSSRYTYEDKALESRCLTERMMQTNRDIPVVLPTAFFESEKLLRNKLLMYRFRNYDIILENNNPLLLENIEPRLRQATQSFTVLFQHDQEMRDQFSNFMLKYQEDLIEERAGSWEGMIVNTIRNLIESGQEHITTSDITSKVNDNLTRKEELSKNKIGRVLKSLNVVTKVKRVGLKSKRVIDVDKNTLHILYTRYIPDYNVTNVTDVTDTTGTPLPPTHSTIHKKSEEEGVSVYAVTSVTSVTQKIKDFMKNNNGNVVGVYRKDIAKVVEISPEELDNVMEKLEKAGEVMRGPDNLWILSKKA